MKALSSTSTIASLFLLANGLSGCSVLSKDSLTPDSVQYGQCYVPVVSTKVSPPLLQPDHSLVPFVLKAFRASLGEVCGPKALEHVVDPLVILDGEEKPSVVAYEDSWLKAHGFRNRENDTPLTRESVSNIAGRGSAAGSFNLGAFAGIPFGASEFYLAGRARGLADGDLYAVFAHELCHALTAARDLTHSKVPPEMALTFDETISEACESIARDNIFSSMKGFHNKGKWHHEYLSGDPHGAADTVKPAIDRLSRGIDVTENALQSPEALGQAIGKIHNAVYVEMTTGPTAWTIASYAATQNLRFELYSYAYYDQNHSVRPDIAACEETDPVLQEDIKLGVLARGVPDATLQRIQACANARTLDLQKATRQAYNNAVRILSDGLQRNANRSITPHSGNSAPQP